MAFAQLITVLLLCLPHRGGDRPTGPHVLLREGCKGNALIHKCNVTLHDHEAAQLLQLGFQFSAHFASVVGVGLREAVHAAISLSERSS